MITLYRDPHGERIFESGPPTTASILTQREDNTTTVADLKRTVEELEMQIVQFKVYGESDRAYASLHTTPSNHFSIVLAYIAQWSQIGGGFLGSGKWGNCSGSNCSAL